MYYNGGGDNYIGSGTRLAMAPQFGNHVRIHTSGSGVQILINLLVRVSLKDELIVGVA